jgi:hypothetical protein
MDAEDDDSVAPQSGRYNNEAELNHCPKNNTQANMI